MALHLRDAKGNPVTDRASVPPALQRALRPEQALIASGYWLVSLTTINGGRALTITNQQHDSSLVLDAEQMREFARMIEDALDA